eukprot:s740_g15.t1
MRYSDEMRWRFTFCVGCAMAHQDVEMRGTNHRTGKKSEALKRRQPLSRAVWILRFDAVYMSVCGLLSGHVFGFPRCSVYANTPRDLALPPLYNPKYIVGALRDYTVAFHLVPLPKFAMRDDAAPSNSTRRNASEPYSNSFQKGKGKGKSGKTGKSSGSNAAPKGYQGCVGRDAENRPICFDYNISGCNKAPPGGTCAKGRHVCFRGGCFKTHAFKEAHGQDMPEAAE